MKYKTKRTSSKRAQFNAWQIATQGGKLSRVSVAKDRRACRAAFFLDWLNDYADKCANYDNDAERYNEETSARMGRRLEELAEKTAQQLAPFGLVFFNCFHLYGIARKGEQRQIYIKYE